MNRSVWGSILAMILIIAFIIIGLVVVVSYFTSQLELVIGLIIVLGVAVLLVLLYIMAAGFAALSMSDSKQAMRLPQGSIRAIIALFLIVVWVILSAFLYGAVQNSNNNTEVIRLAQQLFTTMSTLAVAVASFYFGSRSVASARAALEASTSQQPAIWKVDPNQGKQGAIGFSLTI